MATDETRALARIRKLITEACREEGLVLTGLTIDPAVTEDGTTGVTISIYNDDEAPPERSGEHDDEFERVMAEAAAAEAAAEADKAREGLTELQDKLGNHGDGIL